MSHMQGIQTGHVEVIVWNGDLMVASADTNEDLFNLVRAGIGQFGVLLTLVSIPLVQAPRYILTFRVFFTPSMKKCIVGIVGSDTYMASSAKTISADD